MPSIASLIDHTLLRPDVAAGDIDVLCRDAAEYGFRTVCVNPTWVRRSAEALATSAVHVCSVVAFPFGATPPEVKVYEARRAIADGAQEIDAVMNLGALKSGDMRQFEEDIDGIARACREAGALCKIILETPLLTDEQKIAACRVALRAGADFVKTSTGFGPAGATTADVALMRRIVGSAMGVKAAGGVRDLDAAQAMIDAGATRIGTSAGVRIVLEERAKA
jgi:deoxyribose-phosphate aldolase